MRCNLAQDVHLQEGVYCWNDIAAAISGLVLTDPNDRIKCIGVIEGYLKYKHEKKLSFNPRSTKLLAIFAPWDEEIHLPFELGAEDTLAFRLPPHQLGGPIRWMRQLFCIDGARTNKIAIRQKIDSGEWPTPLSDKLRRDCAEVAQYNIASRNEQDMLEQKRLYII